MKRTKTLFFGVLVLCGSFRVSAQSDFFFNLYGGSSNLWSNIYLQVPSNFVNAYVSAAIDDDDEAAFSGGALRYDLFKIKQAGEKVSIDRGKYWGFRSKDMFNNVQYGFKFGWQPQLSPFGIYISCAYQFNKFGAQMNPEVDVLQKYKMHSVRPGIGVRITPFINMLEDSGWSPIIELGTSYNYYFRCKAPYESDKEQFKSGMISTAALGARWENFSVSGGVELDHYSMFNQDYTPDGGTTFPYKDIKSSKVTIFLSVSRDF